jgi:hypothetical protein
MILSGPRVAAEIAGRVTYAAWRLRSRPGRRAPLPDSCGVKRVTQKRVIANQTFLTYAIVSTM